MRVQVKMSEYVEDILNAIYGTADIEEIDSDIVEVVTEAQHENDVVDGPPLSSADVRMIISAFKAGDENAIQVRAPRPKKKSPFTKEGQEEQRELMKEELRMELKAEMQEAVREAMKDQNKGSRRSKGGKAETQEATETAE